MIKNIILSIIISAQAMYLTEFYTHDPFVRMNPGIQVLNIFLFVMMTAFLIFLTGSFRASLQILTVFFMILGLAEYYLVEFRGVPLLPWDFGSLGTAAEVAGGYDYMPGARALITMGGFGLLFLLTFLTDAKKTCPISGTAALRAGGCAISLCLIMLYAFAIRTDAVQDTFGFYTKLFTPKAMSERDGTMTAFLLELQYMNVKKPRGYDRKEAEEILSGYGEGKAPDKKADIIVVMNESFADLSVLGDMRTDTDCMPYVHSIMRGEEPGISGLMDVSIVGGNTPNTEFEYLTGCSLAFLPEGSIPYQQYVREETSAMPEYLASLGYGTVAVHPYYAKGWDRQRVYPEIGFEKSVFIENFEPGVDTVRGYVSDMACTERIIREYDEIKKSGRNAFVFCVTMQNHSPYDGDSDDLTVDVKLDADVRSKKVRACNRYLSLVKRSDEAFRALTDHFRDSSDPVVIVMFGDHQPSDSLVRPVWEMNGKDDRALDDRDSDMRYVVPYVIWSSDGTVTETDRECSANYLGNMTLEAAGAGLDPYRCFLEDMMREHPVLSAVRITSAEGGELSEKEKKSDESLNMYRKIQYHELFDRKDQ